MDPAAVFSLCSSLAALGPETVTLVQVGAAVVILSFLVGATNQLVQLVAHLRGRTGDYATIKQLAELSLSIDRRVSALEKRTDVIETTLTRMLQDIQRSLGVIEGQMRSIPCANGRPPFCEPE